MFERNRSKKVELLARAYDHANHRYRFGFRMLTLGWSDGSTFLPVNSVLLSSENKKNRVNEAAAVDKRTTGYKRRMLSIQKGTQAMLELLNAAKKAAIPAKYVLFDSWFSSPSTIHAVKEIGYDVIGMVKQLNQRYRFRGRYYTLPELRKFVSHNSGSDLFGSLCVETKGGIPVKIVFVRNRNKKSECLYLLSTNTLLSDSEIVRIYGNRWSIECFFKASKSFLKLGTEFQCRSYSAMVSHTTIVFVRYILLEWIRRNENDAHSYGELFFLLCDDVQDMELTDALQSLMTLFVDMASGFSAAVTELIKSQVSNWIATQARFIRDMFSNLCWES